MNHSSIKKTVTDNLIPKKLIQNMRDASGLSVENRWRYAKWHKSKSVVPGLMDWRNKFDTFGSNHHYIQRRQGVQQWVSIAIRRLWFKTAFQPVIYGILSKSIHSRTKKNQILSHYVVPSGKHLIANRSQTHGQSSKSIPR